MSKSKNIETLIQSLRNELDANKHLFVDKFGRSKIKGIVLGDKILTIGNDTKLLSTTFELMLKEVIDSFINKNPDFEAIYPDAQNKYPDVTLRDKGTGFLYALDFKSTYKIDHNKVSGFTLGTYRGYFRDRNSTKNIMFPYKDYKAHFVMGVIYTPNENASPEGELWDLNKKEKIIPVIKDMEFIVQEKYKISSDRPGSGNTTNIGSVTCLNKLKTGGGHFAMAGEGIFDHYWVNYLRVEDERARGLNSTYKSLNEYQQMTIDDYMLMLEK